MNNPIFFIPGVVNWLKSPRNMGTMLAKLNLGVAGLIALGGLTLFAYLWTFAGRLDFGGVMALIVAQALIVCTTYVLSHLCILNHDELMAVDYNRPYSFTQIVAVNIKYYFFSIAAGTFSYGIIMALFSWSGSYALRTFSSSAGFIGGAVSLFVSLLSAISLVLLGHFISEFLGMFRDFTLNSGGPAEKPAPLSDVDKMAA